MNTAQERADFEAWAAKGGLQLHKVTPCDGSEPYYADSVGPTAWASWQARAALQSQDREDAEVTAYALPGGISVEQCMQRYGTFLWAVRDSFKNCLSKSGEWDYEHLPRSRTDDWIAHHRFESAAEAIDHARRIEGDNHV